MTSILRPSLGSTLNNIFGTNPTKRSRSPEKTPASASKRIKKIPPPSREKDPSREEDKLKKKAQREANEEEFRIKYSKAFPNWTFFFNTPEATRDSFLPRIHDLGGRYEPFFSSKITHVVTMHRQPSSSGTNKENVPKHSTLKSPIKLATKPRKADEDLLAKARQFQMKIWDAEKLDSVLNRVLLASSSLKLNSRNPTTLHDILEAERRSGVTSERDPHARRPDYFYFSKHSCFVLVEDMSGHFAPIAAQEYPVQGKPGSITGSWPTLYMHPLSHSPFVPYDGKEAKRRKQIQEAEEIRKQEKKLRILRKERAKEEEEERERQSFRLRRTVSMVNVGCNPPHDEVEIVDEETRGDNASGVQLSGYVAASGNSVAVLSGTGTTSTTGTLHRASQPSLTLRKQLANQVLLPRNMGDANPRLRKSKSTTTMRLPKRDESLKPGFCESCKVKFQDFNSHVVGKKHRRFAMNDENFLELDCVLARVKRRSLNELQKQRAAEENNQPLFFDESVS